MLLFLKTILQSIAQKNLNSNFLFFFLFFLERVTRIARRTFYKPGGSVGRGLREGRSGRNYRDLDDPLDEHHRNLDDNKWGSKRDESTMDFQELLHEHVAREYCFLHCNFLSIRISRNTHNLSV